jgi:uncharacterized Zn-binding protein involved in type VI secretion
MGGISRVGVNSAGGVIQGPGEPTFTLDGAVVSVLNDDVAGHGVGSHAGPKMVEGSAWMSWNGVPVVRAGNKASCGHEADGHPTWDIE